MNSAQTASYDLSVELSVMAQDPGNPDMVDLRLSRIKRAYQRLGLELDALEEDERLKVAVNVGGGTWTKVAQDGTVKRVAVSRDWPDPVSGTRRANAPRTRPGRLIAYRDDEPCSDAPTLRAFGRLTAWPRSS